MEYKYRDNKPIVPVLVGRNLFGGIDVHLLGKSGRLVMDLEVVEV